MNKNKIDFIHRNITEMETKHNTNTRRHQWYFKKKKKKTSYIEILLI